MLRSPTQPPPEQARILIVDDEKVNLDVLGRFLAPERYQVITASDGEKALQAITREKPDLILLDVMMPGLGGLEVCKRVKSSPATLFLPVVLVTGLANTEDRVKGTEAGADDFLTKPVNKEELVTRVKSLLRIKFLHAALEASNRQLNEVLKERTQALEEATRELQKLLEEKAVFTSRLTPPHP